MMRTLVVAAMAVSLLVGVVPAMASDDAEFLALSTVTMPANENLAPMPDDQLAAVEGQFLDNFCVACNLAVVTQTNVLAQIGAVVGDGYVENYAEQYNESYIDQYLDQTADSFNN